MLKSEKSCFSERAILACIPVGAGQQRNAFGIFANCGSPTELFIFDIGQKREGAFSYRLFLHNPFPSDEHREPECCGRSSVYISGAG